MSGFRIYLSPPHMEAKEREYLLDAFDSNWIAPLGPHVEGFEKEFAAYIGVRAALALNSGTSALHLALKVLGVKPGDSVLCSSFTFIASANPIVYEGARPIFVDSERTSWNLCARSLERAIEEETKQGRKPKALVAVNLYGQSSDFSQIIPVCERYGIPIIEDAAESLGATYQGKQTGNFGKLSAFSFNGNKIITTSGGGMLVSNDEELLKKARYLSTQARDPVHYYQHSEVGYNYRLSNLLAAVGRGQLQSLNARVNRRREIFRTYETALGRLDGVQMMPEIRDGRSTRWLSLLLVGSEKIRDTLIQELGAKGIEARAAWKPMHLQPVFRGHAMYAVEAKPVSDDLFNRGICLPSGSSLTPDQQLEVIETITPLLKSARASR